MSASRPRRTYVVENLVRKPPRSDPSWAAVRTDAGVDNLSIGIGVLVSEIFRYDTLHAEGVGALHGCDKMPTSDFAEMLAVYHGLCVARELGFRSAHIVTDSQGILHVLRGGRIRDRSDVHYVMDFLMPLTRRFDALSVKWVPREHNRQADMLSKMARRGMRRND